MSFFSKKPKDDPKNFKEILARFKELKENFQKISEELAEMKKQNKFSIQKVGVVRFNPFREVGGDQSFSIALLNDDDCGVVITSYYSRKDNRIYGKPVKNGNSEYALSEEEINAIQIAKNSKENKMLGERGKNEKKKANDAS